LRKGISGDWKNKFSREAKQIFNEYAGKELIQLELMTAGLKND